MKKSSKIAFSKQNAFSVGLAIAACGSSALSLWIALDLNRTLVVAPPPEQMTNVLLLEKIEIYQELKGLFLVTLTILAGAATVLGLGVYEVLRRAIENDVEGLISEKISIAQARAIGVAFNEFAYSKWQEYEPIFQKYLELGPDPTKSFDKADLEVCLNHITVAEDMLKNGKNFIDDLDEKSLSHFVADADSLHVLINLLNGKVYAAAARIILENEAPAPEFLEEILQYVNRLQDYSTSRTAEQKKYFWWEGLETVGFFKYHVGRILKDEKMQKEGSRLLQDMMKGKRIKSYLSDIDQKCANQIKREYPDRGYSLD